MVPVGAITVVCALRNPLILPLLYASFQHCCARFEQRRRYSAAVDIAHRFAMHPDHFEERMLIAAVSRERTGRLRDPRAGQVRLTAHNGSDRTGEVAALVAVIRHAHRHQQRPKIREAQTKRTVIV